MDEEDEEWEEEEDDEEAQEEDWEEEEDETFDDELSTGPETLGPTEAPLPREGFKAGFIALIGRPNVGKSTLMNRLLGRKLSIISPKPQTTRHRILGVKTLPQAQLLFLDTPGIHRAQVLLNREMVKAALKAAGEADLILWMVDAEDPFTDDDQLILEALQKARVPLLLAINKVDLVKKETLLPLIERFRQRLPFKEIVPISATEGDNVERLEELLITYLPEGHPFYPEDQLTDRSERFFIAELIREKVHHFCHQEIPYAVAVEVESFKERKERPLVEIQATIYVEKDSQKGIVIGAGGRMLKKIGEIARQEIEAFLGTQVFLHLWVKVRPAWRKDEHALKEFGYFQR
ncbi:MAG: GTPase Era [candidate division NC10 bacterium]|nr:GTPase Era [candidate division NC10 bacterium]